jgi:uncharacterized membrane protein
MTLAASTQWDIFLGRFHPLIVHLPIGFLLLAVLLWALAWRRQNPHLQQAVGYSLLLGAVSALASVGLGLLLAGSGSYEGSTLQWHKWLGILLVAVSFAAWYANQYLHPARPRLQAGLMGSVVGLLLVAGHLGGNLTHGPDYLVQHAPAVVQKLAFYENQSPARQFSGLSPDTIQLYGHLVRPVLEARCASCHNEQRSQGGLVLTDPGSLLKGGDTGPAITAGAAHRSELLHRVTLPRRNEKFMPPRGEPLTYYETKLLEWWINSGASFDQKLTAYQVPADLKQVLQNDYGLRLDPVPYLETAEAGPFSEHLIGKLREQGFRVRKISQDKNFVEVLYVGSPDELNAAKMEALLALRDQVAWLDLSQAQVQGQVLAPVAQLPNLTLLRLDQTGITDQSLGYLLPLKHLEALSLVGTAITDAALDQLRSLPSLRRVYVWKTAVSPEAVTALKTARPTLEVDTGFRFTSN